MGLVRENGIDHESMMTGLRRGADLIGRDIENVGVADLNSLMDVMVEKVRRHNYLAENVKMENVVEDNSMNAASEMVVDLAFEVMYLRRGGYGRANAMTEISGLVHTSFFRRVRLLSGAKMASQYSLWKLGCLSVLISERVKPKYLMVEFRKNSYLLFATAVEEDPLYLMNPYTRAQEVSVFAEL
jgi:hypothetical protein